jgi:hypothetical protein
MPGPWAAKPYVMRPVYFMSDSLYKNIQGGMKMTSPPTAGHAASARGAREADGVGLGVDAKVTPTPPCIFFIEVH